MKTKLLTAMIACALLISLTGCAADKIAPTPAHNVDGTMNTEVTTEPARETEAATPTSETAEKEMPAQPASTEAPQTSEIAEPVRPGKTEIPKQTEASGQSGSTEAPKQESPSRPAEPQPEPTKPAEPPKETEQPKPTEPPAPPSPTEPAPTEPEEDLFGEADHRRIIAEVKAYAESYNEKGFRFVWNETMTFGWDVGYMGTPRVQYNGVDGVIKTLKHHIDLIYKTSADPMYGITAEQMTYKIEQITVDGDLAYVVIYGG